MVKKFEEKSLCYYRIHIAYLLKSFGGNWINITTYPYLQAEIVSQLGKKEKQENVDLILKGPSRALLDLQN